MVDTETARDEIRKLSQLKDYPRSWGESDPIRADQQDRAEFSLIEAAADAPSVAALRGFVAGWMRQHIEAPKPAHLYGAWRGPEVPNYQPSRSVRCQVCGDSGWAIRYVVCDAIGGDTRNRIVIAEAEVDDWWERIRKAQPACSQQVYSEAYRCRCSRLGTVEHDQAKIAAGDR